MIQRLLTTSNNNSFFLFGPRGTGKTTWLKDRFAKEAPLWIDLLDKDVEEKLLLDPSRLAQEIAAMKSSKEWVVIDEIQKAPKLLDLVHKQIEENNIKFALTGSSARKLKRGAANLLAGRAFLNYLHPLTFRETQNTWPLEDIMRWGSLPKVLNLSSQEEKKHFLKTYTQVYLSEEIVAEQLVRNLTPFRRFLPVAAQGNGQILNYANVSRDIGVDIKTVEAYYEILEDTLMGFRLYPYLSSFRKRLSHKPKFYFFDPGIVRALTRSLDIPLQPRTSGYGDIFEHVVILEFYRLSSYFRSDYELAFIKTKDDAEVDLVIDKPSHPPILIEIKSKTMIQEKDISSLQRLARDIKGSRAYCLSQDPSPQIIGTVSCLPWEKGICEILELPSS
ncbi:MAG: hypothetical protein ACD_62C00314G0001 [uncultured bacterium]|nr:MAG: hypothetical protein ACD_62C00314G0001 [uncultured bacterium]HLD45996.1 AAA family ATPase [bacterium]